MTIQISFAPSLSDPAQLVHTAFIRRCISFSTCALGIYEYLITLPEEVAYVWCRHFTPASALLLLLRYGTFAYGGIAVGSSLVTTDKMCTIMGRLGAITNLLSMTAVCLASALRAHALSRKLWLVSIVVLLGMAPVAANIPFVLRLSSVTTSMTGARCLEVYKPNLGTQIRFIDSLAILVARLSTALVDLIVIIVTLKATMSSYRAARQTGIQVPIMAALIRDGTLYFFAAFVTNIAHVLLYETLHGLYLTSFIYIITPILLSRLLLNLREVADDTNGDPNSTNTSRSVMAIMVPASFMRLQTEVDFCADQDLEAQDSRLS